MSVFFDSDSEVNAMHLVFKKKLDLITKSTNIEAQKIDGTTLKTYAIVIATFSVIDKAKKVRFFEEIILVADVSLDLVLEIYSLILSGTNHDFLKRKL